MQLEKFTETYNQLNKQQKKAVDTIEGPVMVIAGPGTGKTQILSTRIGNILLQPGIDPQNILCLTYTDVGAVAMRRRLTEIIGTEAHKVNVGTFHSFCNQVIVENQLLFGFDSLNLITDLEQVQLYRKLIDGFKKGNPLKRYSRDVYYERKRLEGLFSIMKKENLSAKYISDCIDVYLNELTERPEFVYKKKYKEHKVGELKQSGVDETKRMELLRTAANEYPRFDQLMQEHGFYDYDDMIIKVINEFDRNEDLLRQYQEQYQYILVDEYQDTSGSQNRLVQQLISYWDKPNIFVVGDDDQSIYRFQGANIDNMLDIANKYGNDLETIVLTENYRSTQQILDCSKLLIENNAGRLINQWPHLSKDLVAANKDLGQYQHYPSINIYSTEQAEMIHITKEVGKLIQQGVNPKEIGIIYTKNSYGEALSTFFVHQQIPFYIKQQLDLLKVPITKNIITLLSYISAELSSPFINDSKLFEVLHFDWFNIPPIEIAKLSFAVAEHNKHKGKKLSFREYLYQKLNKYDDANAIIHPTLKAAFEVLERLIKESKNVGLQVFFEKVIYSTGILAYVMNQPNRNILLRYITTLFNHLKANTQKNPRLSLQEFIETVELMVQEEIILPFNQTTGSEKGVNLTTVHSAKGLEFEYVFFVSCNSNLWEGKRNNNKGYKFPDTIVHANANEKDLEEQRRLFYVALTRAKHHLNISYCQQTEDGKPLTPSVFIAEINKGGLLTQQIIELDEDDSATFQALIFTEPPINVEKEELDFITPILENMVLSVSSLNTYLACPVSYYYQKIIKVPSAGNEAMAFGNAVHKALETLYGSKKVDIIAKDLGSEHQFPTLQQTIASFTYAMEKQRDCFTQVQYDRKIEYGHKVLTEYYEHYIKEAIGKNNTTYEVEYKIDKVVLDGIPLTGNIDKIEITGNEITLVDYKTGKADKIGDSLKAPNEKNELGGNYWRQAVFYKILIDNQTKHHWKLNDVFFDYVEKTKDKVFEKKKVIIEPAHEEIVKNQIKEAWRGIQNKEFDNGCNDKNCYWCNFKKQKSLALEEESEDEVDE